MLTMHWHFRCRIDRRNYMEHWLQAHRRHNPEWANLTPESFVWKLRHWEKKRAMEEAEEAQRIPGDLGALWKRARAGQGGPRRCLPSSLSLLVLRPFLLPSLSPPSFTDSQFPSFLPPLSFP